MEMNVRFKNNFVLTSAKYEDMKTKIFSAIKKELPDEAQTYEIISYIFDELKEELKVKNINL